MGSIKKSHSDIIVTWDPPDISKLIMEKAYIEIPGTPPPPGATVVVDHIGNQIAKVAWRLVLEKTDYARPIRETTIEAKKDGTIIVTFRGNNLAQEEYERTYGNSKSRNAV